MNEISEHTIDIDRILSSKMGSKARFVPSLLTNWLKRIIHQDQVNAFIWKTRDMQGVEWLEECVRYLKMDIEIVGKENLPPKDDGRLYTFVSNHPLGGQDGVALGSIIGRHYDGRFRYLVNDLLMNLPGLAPVCIGINKTGRNGRDFPRMVEAGFKSDNHMLMFPAGLNSRRQKDGNYTRYRLEEDIHREERGVPARRSTNTFQRTELQSLLSHSQLQRPLPAVQSRHDIPCRRDVSQCWQAFHHTHRQAYTMADLRPFSKACRMGTVCRGHCLRIAGKR